MSAGTHRAWFRFYGSLNDFLPPSVRGRDVEYGFSLSPSIKDAMEALGVVHPEVKLILLNGEITPWKTGLSPGDRVSLYPRFKSQGMAPAGFDDTYIPDSFYCDVHLGRLTRYLRLLGLDVSHDGQKRNEMTLQAALGQNASVLTRDRTLLRRSAVTYGHWLRSQDPLLQLAEVAEEYPLEERVRPLSRCTECNFAPLEAHPPSALRERLTALGLREESVEYYETYWLCPRCGKIYWRGSHLKRFANIVKERVPSLATLFSHFEVR